MIVKCPKCEVKFRVPANLIGLAGKTLQCGKCEHKWYMQVTQEDLQNDVDEVTNTEKTDTDFKNDNVTEVDEQEAEVTEPKEDKAYEIYEIETYDDNKDDRIFIDKKFIALSFFAFLVLTALFVVLFPSKVIRNFPEIYPLYKFLKIENNVLEYKILSAKYRKDHYGQDILYVEMQIKNISNKKQKPEPLQLALYSKDGELLKEWEVPARDNLVPPEQEIVSKFGLRNPPKGGKEIIVSRDIEKIYNIKMRDKDNNKEDNNSEAHKEVEH